MRKYDFPLAPLLIAYVLTPRAEIALRQALIISDGSFSILVTRPISLGFLLLAGLAVYQLMRITMHARRHAPAD